MVLEVSNPTFNCNKKTTLVKDIIKIGVLKNVVDIHRTCIDKATARKAKKQG